MTYRYRGHSMSDSNVYRSKEEEKQWVERDPILILTKKLKDEGVVSDDDIKAMEKEIDDEIENDIVKFAEESPEPKVEDLTKYVLDDNPDPRWIGPLQNKEA
jgi:pyruvate dehydrogenase E1 component alpha subunit